MTDATIDLNSIDSTTSLTLAVGWKSGQKTKLRQVSIGATVETAFRGVIASVLQDLNDREAEEWTPEADLTPETYLVLPIDDVGSAPVLATDHPDQKLAGALAAAEDLPPLHPNDLPAPDLSFYSITVGNNPGQRSVFLRRANPRRGLKRGRIYTLLGDSLQRLEEPIFAFDDYVDLVFTSDKVCVLSQSVFAAIFRDQDTLKARIPGWANDLNEHVPMVDAGRERLTSRALKDSRLRARLEMIVRRGHLPDVSPEIMRSAMKDSGLDPDVLMDKSGKLVLEDADIPQVLYFLNEDLFVGALSSTGFRADKKAAR